jgi:hypothetical protein
VGRPIKSPARILRGFYANYAHRSGIFCACASDRVARIEVDGSGVGCFGRRRMLIKMQKVRLNLQVSTELNDVLEEIADSSGTTKTDVIRQAFALLKVAHNAKKNGKHLGLVSDPDRLDTEIVGLL